ncbi:MAG: Mycobacterial 4 phage holin, superfamily [Candidatus Parcubacteria bacterium]|jgi:putative membrane protein
MHTIGRVVIMWAANVLALLIATQIPGFYIRFTAPDLLLVAAILTLLGVTIKPLLTLLFGPVIILTLGLGLIIVNAIVLKVLDILSPVVSITNLSALFYSALLIGFVNFLFHTARR